MKKLAFSVKIFATATLVAVMAACGSGDGKDAKDSAANANATPATEKIKDQGFASSANFRFVDDTLLMKNYEFAKVTYEQCQKIALDLQTYQNGLAKQLQNKQAAIQQKMQSNGNLSDASYNADVAELQKLDQSLQAQYAKRAQADNDKINKLTQAVSDAIDNYIARYNKEKKYDAILSRAAGLYFNPQLDVTNEIVAGLNAEYKAAGEKK